MPATRPITPGGPGDTGNPMRYSIFSVQDHYPGEKYPGHRRTVPDLYQEVIDQAQLADRLGYDTFFVAEHHFHEYGAVPNPAVMLGHLAARTQRIRLGSAISILTFHDPRVVAESYAMVDALSGGRLVLGVGSGYLKHEFEGFGVDGAEKRDRFDENLGLVRRLLSGERVSHEGTYQRLDDVQINVPCVQRPHPPIKVAVLRAEAAYHIGHAGHDLMCVPYASVDRWEDIAPLVASFHAGRSEAGIAGHEDDAIVALHTHVADTPEAVRRNAAAPFDLYVDSRLYAKKQTYDDIMASGLSLFGTPDEVADKLVELHDNGVQHVMMLQNFGHMPPETVKRSMELVADEVMPRVNRRVADRRAQG
ncbi:LLM class flavin-dependent oxidoreductase [Arhodomonas sp. SL1]|uniref:LLM class flavin-dependent oxidoreductase n=1 Tax=Arhodomonas sp. SL1 TaxID=3425691 RepID=UPI003F882E5F